MNVQTRPQDTVSQNQYQYLTFFIAEEEFAVGILKVREIVEYEVVTKIPGAPPSVRGVINLRGAVVPVVDLAVKFGLPERPVTKWTCVVIAEVENSGKNTTMGVIVDVISKVIDLPESEIEPPPDFGTKVHLDYLLGMGRSDKKFVMILDIDKVLSAAELSTIVGIHDELANVDDAATGDVEDPLVIG